METSVANTLVATVDLFAQIWHFRNIFIIFKYKNLIVNYSTVMDFQFQEYSFWPSKSHVIEKD